MGEPRWVDNVRCNPNLDPFCQVYELDIDPNNHNLRLLNMNYLLQILIVGLAAGAGEASWDDTFSDFSGTVLLILAEVSVLLFTLPSLFLGITNIFGLHIFPRVSIWLL